MSGSSFSATEFPWIGGNLRVSRAVIDAVDAHALEAYPNESCGFLLGPMTDGVAIDEAVREVNEADRYHALDPVTFPRTARTYFKINELRAERAFEAAHHAGRALKVIYHSHCDAGAYFSAEDAATFAHDGALMWPCAFLVTSVEGRVVADRKLWIFDAVSRAFVESALTIG